MKQVASAFDFDGNLKLFISSADTYNPDIEMDIDVRADIEYGASPIFKLHIFDKSFSISEKLDYIITIEGNIESYTQLKDETNTVIGYSYKVVFSNLVDKLKEALVISDFNDCLFTISYLYNNKEITILDKHGISAQLDGNDIRLCDLRNL